MAKKKEVKDLSSVLRRCPGRHEYADEVTALTGVTKRDVLAWAREAGITLAHEMHRTGAGPDAGLQQIKSRTILIGVMAQKPGAPREEATGEEIETIAGLFAQLERNREKIQQTIASANETLTRIEAKAALRSSSAPKTASKPEPVSESPFFDEGPAKGITGALDSTTLSVDQACQLLRNGRLTVEHDGQIIHLTAKPIEIIRASKSYRGEYSKQAHRTMYWWLRQLAETDQGGWIHAENPALTELPDLRVVIS